MTELKAKAARGYAWMIGARQAVRALGLISTFVLARILMPADFGLVAQSMMVLAFMELISSFGFEQSLIQNQEAGRKEYDTVWTLNIIKSAVTSAGLALVAAPMASFFDEPRLENVIYALAGVSFLRGLVNVGIVDFRKQLWFGPEFAIMVGPKIVGIAVNIGVAIWLRSYWALVIGSLANTFASLIISYIASKYRPRLSLETWREMFGFSKWILFSSYINFISVQAPVFLIGKTLGSMEVGYYKMAAEISNFLSSEISLPALRVLYPAYAKDKNGAGSLYIEAVGICFLLLAPACVGISLVARPAVSLILGENWLPVVPLIEVLAIGRLLYSIWLSPGAVAMARGRPRDNTFLTLAMALISVPGLVILTPKYGIVGAGWAILSGSIVYYLTCLVYVVLAVKVPLAHVISVKWRTYASVGLMAAVLLQMPQDLWRIPAGIAVYVASQFILWHVTGRKRGPEYHVFTRLGFKAPDAIVKPEV